MKEDTHMKEDESVFEDRITLAFVLHVRLDAVKGLKESIESVPGADIVYQRKSEGKLYITPEKPGPGHLGGEDRVKEE